MRHTVHALTALAVISATVPAAAGDAFVFGNHFEGLWGGGCQGPINECDAVLVDPPSNTFVLITNVSCRIEADKRLNLVELRQPNRIRRAYPDLPQPDPNVPGTSMQFAMQTSFLAGGRFGWPNIHAAFEGAGGAQIFCHVAGIVVR